MFDTPISIWIEQTPSATLSNEVFTSAATVQSNLGGITNNASFTAIGTISF